MAARNGVGAGASSAWRPANGAGVRVKGEMEAAGMENPASGGEKKAMIRF
jgi:hypothetical protein